MLSGSISVSAVLLPLLLCCCMTVSVAWAQCPPLSPPLFGSLSTSAVALNTVVAVLCEPGFAVYGAATSLTCLASNQWSFPVPLCVVDCSRNVIADVDPFTGASSGTTVPRIDLTVLTHSGAVAGSTVGNTLAYQYFGQFRIPAPTILMRAGTTCRVRIINKLSNPSPSDADYGLCPYFANRAHCLNTTNLHVHGLHVAPQEDNVGITVSPGTYYDYVYHIPDDHHAGTFWYHSHYHGSIDYQVGVMSGAIIVLQNEGVLPTPAPWASLYVDQRLVLFQEVGGSAFQGNTLSSFFIVNGQYNASIDVNSNSWTLFRFVHAAGQHMVLSLNIVDPSSTCTMTVVARDGIPQYLPFVIPQHLIVPQGGRADVAVYCGTAAQGSAVTVQSVYNSSHSAFLGANDIFPQTSLFRLNVQPPPFTVQTVPQSNKPLPAALQDLTLSNALPTTNLSLSLFTGISDVTFTGLGSGASYVNSVALQLNEVYSYSLTADLPFIFHPYHQHVNALQIQSYDGATYVDEISRPGEWRDVLPIHGAVVINVKQKVVDFWGQQVLHCHIFTHEEGGMMGVLQIATPSSISCSSAYVQPGYVVHGCDAGTVANSTCSATCANGHGTATGAVSCQQLSPYIARPAFVGSFSGCQPS